MKIPCTRRIAPDCPGYAYRDRPQPTTVCFACKRFQARETKLALRKKAIRKDGRYRVRFTHTSWQVYDTQERKLYNSYNVKHVAQIIATRLNNKEPL